MPNSAAVSLIFFCAAAGPLLMSRNALAGTTGQCLDFSAYSARRDFKGPYARAKLGKASPGHRYRTLIRSEAHAPPNFAGHLQIIEFGCGSDCHLLVIVDKRTGVVWAPGATLAAALGFEYKLSSRLLVIDPPSEIVEEPHGSLLRKTVKTISYVWDESRHMLRKLPGCNGYKHQ